MGDDTTHGPGPGEEGGGPTWGSSTDHWEEVPEVIGWEMGVSTSVDGDSRGGV